MTPVAVGEQAPDFALRSQRGATIRLSDHRGESVVLVFFPFAFSKVCSGELQALRDGWDVVAPTGSRLLAVSCDPVFALRAWSDAEGIEFPLLSDFWPHGAASAAYGVLNEDRGCPRRSTFVIDREGVVRWSVHSGMGEARDPQAYAAALAGLPG